MRHKIWALAGALAMWTVTLGAVSAHAKCDPTGADAADVANARAAVAANCNCATATNHGSYVSCAAQQANATLVNKTCKGAVVMCAAHSTCGKPGFVTCCTVNAKGKSKCSIKPSASKCVPPKGGSACVGVHASCCDACKPSGGCASPSGAFVDGFPF